VQEGGNAMTEPTEEQPVAVPIKAIRTGKARDPRFWVEPTVWTERMMAALEQGVKGGKMPSLPNTGCTA
jgi:RNA-directed DNA polymerase